VIFDLPRLLQFRAFIFAMNENMRICSRREPHVLPTHLSIDSTLWTILTEIGDIIIYNFNNILCALAPVENQYNSVYDVIIIIHYTAKHM